MSKNTDLETRQKILSGLGPTTVPSRPIAAMKANLNIPWHQLRLISRWLRTFNIALGSEKQARLISKEWIGPGLQVEMAPLTTSSCEVVEKPWTYLYNIVAYILQRLKLLKSTKTFVDYKSMQNEVHIKIGGDHGGGSFKMAFQNANVLNPNRGTNTTVFSSFNGKDTKANLKTCLARFKPHVNMLQKLKFEERTIRVFMYGNYKFLCVMYGLTSANGK